MVDEILHLFIKILAHATDYVFHLQPYCYIISEHIRCRNVVLSANSDSIAIGQGTILIIDQQSPWLDSMLIIEQKERKKTVNKGLKQLTCREIW